MSQILKKYKEKAEYLQKLTESYQTLTSALLSSLSNFVKGDPALEKEVTAISKRVKNAKNIFQVQQINKDFLALTKKIRGYLKSAGKAGPGFLDSLGSLFGGKGNVSGVSPARAPGEGIELVDKLDEILGPYINLLNELSKGALLLADDDEDFCEPLKGEKSKNFGALANETVDPMVGPIYNFFIGKTNEATVVDNEKKELKNIIGAMAGYIQSLSVTSDKFGAKLDNYAKAITMAVTMDQIKKIKTAILSETLRIQKENSQVGQKLAEAKNSVRMAGQKIAELEKNLQAARAEKSVDALTKLYNRGYFDERLDEALIQFRRDKQPCCLIMFDVDHFKKFNDSFGHQAGDQALRVVAGLAKEKVRAGDTVARYGGEEFVVILYKANIKQGAKLAEEIRLNIDRHELGLKGRTVKLSISLGVSEFTAEDTSETLIKRVDTALYKAKESGRNKVVTG